MQFTVLLSKEADGRYSVFCPACDNIGSSGNDREHALSMMAEAAELWLEIQRDTGQTADAETPELLGRAVERILAYRKESGLDMVLEFGTIIVPLAAAA
jgi:predicted RNase H-like HicB family nuclease